MRRRARRRAHGDNLDSFLDILTNTVGVLIFVLLFVALTAADASVLVRTPLRQESDKESELFEVRGNRVYRIDTDTASATFEQFLDRLPEFTIYNYEVVAYRIDNFQTTTENHRVDRTGSFLAGASGMRYRLRSDARGDDSRSLRDTASNYQQVLATLDTSKTYVAFIVRPDGFEVFRKARMEAWKRGLQVGWEPRALGDDIVFSSRGRRIDTQ